MYQTFHVRFRLPAMQTCELSAAITQLMSKCLWSGWKWYKGYKKIASSFTCCPVNREYSWKKSQVEKKANYALQHVRRDSWMKSVLNLSWRRSLLYRKHSIDLQNKSIDWFLCDRNFGHERVNALLLLCYLHVFIEIYYLIMAK